MQFVHGRMRWWVQLGLAGAAGLGVSCNVIFGINEYSDDAPSTSSGGGTAGSGGTAGTAGNASSGGVGGSGGLAGSGGTSGSGGVTCTPAEQVPCYDGPPGSRGIGACADGTMECKPTGDAFGPCVGAVKPQTENCDTAVDEACNGSAGDDCGIPVADIWHAGDGNHQAGTAVAIDSTNRPIFVGNFSGNIDLSCGSLAIPSNDTNSFVVQLDSDLGGCGWRAGFGDDGAVQLGQAVALGQGVKPTIAGAYSGQIPQCALSSATGRSYVLQLSGPSGACLWARQLGDAAAGVGVDMDAQGNTLVANIFSGSVDAGCGMSTSQGAGDILVAKLDPAGQCLWQKSFGDSLSQGALDVLVHPDGDIFATGQFQGNLSGVACSESNEGMVNTGGDDIFLMKLDGLDGSCRWLKGFGNASAGVNVGEHLEVTPGGDVLLVGHFTGDIDFGNGSINAPGGDTFIAAFDANGNHAWTRTLGNAGAQVNIAVDKSTGNIVLAGGFVGQLNVEPISLISDSGSKDVLLAKLDPVGTTIWARSIGDSMEQSASGVAVDNGGNIFVTGHFYGAINFGNGSVTSAGGNDVFVTKLSK